MITELHEVPVEVTPGRAINIHKLACMNQSLHRVAHQAILGIIGLMEMPSSNAVGGMSQRDAKIVTDGFKVTQSLVDMAIADIDVPDSGGLEDTGYLAMPVHNELQSITNQRAYNVAKGYADLVRFCVNCDSASMEFEISTADQAGVRRHIARIGNISSVFVGTVDDGGYTRGMDVPVHTEVGQLSPPVTLGVVTLAEPSSDRPTNNPVPDVPDSPSQVPPQYAR